jgi:hypothetical protein
MKAPHLNDNDEALSRVLHEWTVKAALPPRFQDSVWHGIKRREAEGFSWTVFLARFATAITRPTLAGSYLAVLVLAGLLAGHWQAKSAQAHAEAQLSARYVQLVDPYRSPLH